ncbi:hypothetical protein JR316_0012665 [Psilocybe cubensis]|uniref:Uncharacterized protein n=2 Tax=Psilocybe cubensis TaxID=181762 RepID=A0ACB8GKI6_PSICU|nr:hypothetical protein JR316_0012665 [Psilocybe cubensis]KAH9475550.1 hypothetical protein JR316_0012665 [Psilocybe cubensis]
MKQALTDQEIHNLCSKFDVEVREEASYILWCIWKERHTDRASLQDCISALVDDDDLFIALQSAHSSGIYDVIRNWKQKPLKHSVNKDASIEADIRVILSELHPTMKKLVDGEITLPIWTPDFVDSAVSSHLTNLKIPCLKGKPNLLLHDLGSFKNDPMLEKRLKNVFMPNNHTFLVNTSGSGKTRLLLEGLCENWGFYFTSLVDSSLLGSSDVQNSIQTHVPDSPRFRSVLPPPGSAGYESALKTNREIANRLFRQIFLARLIIFNSFAETMNNSIKMNQLTNRAANQDSRTYKARWLLLQLRPSFVHPQVWDIFDELSSKLSGASDSFLNGRTKTLLANVRSLCSQIDNYHPQSSPAGGNFNEISDSGSQMSTSDTAQTPLFCVLDEAQHAATQHNSSFRSDQNGAHRPILREVVKAWEGQSFGQGVFMVVAGTGISKDVVDQAMASAIMKDSRYRWCSDTGAFDHKEVQVRYLQKYLPQSLLDSNAGVRLVERIWYWLHGRYRFTAGYVSELLLNGLKRPHGLLNAYVQHFANFNVTDASMFVKQEGKEALPVLSQYKLDFSKLKKNSDMLTTIQQLTTHYLMRSVLPLTLGKDEAIYVEYGFARFVDSDTKTVAVDEPLVLLAATGWINANHRTSYKYFAKQIHLHDPSSNGFENYIAFCIDLLFSSRRRVNEVFHFSGIGYGAAPAWSSLEAELVALHRTDLDTIEESAVRHSQFFGPSVTLGTNAKSPEDTSSWLGHNSYTPICFPHISMGPDLVFVLRLSDGSLIWVVLQAKYSLGKNGTLSRPNLRKSMRSVTPSYFFLDKDGKHFSPTSYPDLVNEIHERLLGLPRRRADAGKYSLLRVVASFPADTNLKRCIDEDPDQDGHPIASLNMSLIKQITRRMSPIDFLQGLQDPLQNSGRTGKRKRRVDLGSSSQAASRATGSSKKLKLNI